MTDQITIRRSTLIRFIVVVFGVPLIVWAGLGGYRALRYQSVRGEIDTLLAEPQLMGIEQPFSDFLLNPIAEVQPTDVVPITVTKVGLFQRPRTEVCVFSNASIFPTSQSFRDAEAQLTVNGMRIQRTRSDIRTVTENNLGYGDCWLAPVREGHNHASISLQAPEGPHTFAWVFEVADLPE